MTPLARLALLVALAAGACADEKPGARPMADAGPGDAPAERDVAVEVGPAACSCARAGMDIVTTLDCFCQSQDYCSPRALAAALADLETNAPLGCYQIREYAGCGLKVIAEQQGFSPRDSLRVYDMPSGQLVGARLTSDAPVACPFGDGMPEGADLLAGRVPGPLGCAETACKEVCDGLAAETCGPHVP